MKVAFYTLGCKVNQYETEALKLQFKEKGYHIVDSDEWADVYVVNTCTVTRLADRKSRQYIRKVKKKNLDSIIVVTGCYPQVNEEEVLSIEEVDIVTGINKKNEILNLVQEYKKEKNNANLNKTQNFDKILTSKTDIARYGDLNDFVEMGIVSKSENRTRAYIKVQEGCNRFCSYCIIPYARGKNRSRKLENILEEAKGLIKNGYKEIVLTGINTALYGTEQGFFEENDLDNKIQGIEIVISALNQLDGDFRIRLSSLEPTVVNVDYVENLFQYEKLCPHLHLSMQSGSDKILKFMNRNYDREQYFDIVEKLKKKDVGYGITTDIIVGFPNETEQDFQDTLEAVEKVGFSKVHIFKYSKRQGTKAEKMVYQIDGKVKNIRSKKLFEKAEIAANQFFALNEGMKRKVLVEEYLEEDDCLVGYTENYIKCYIKVDFLLKEERNCLINTFVNVTMKKKLKDGMEGEIC